MPEVPNRTVEMYRINDDRTWNKVMVDLPADTPKDQLERAAVFHAIAQHEPATYVMYDRRDDECPEFPAPPRLGVYVRLTFDKDEVTVGSETEQQDAAIELTNLALQRDPYRLGARIDKQVHGPEPHIKVEFMKATVHAVEFGCNLVSEPMDPKLAQELRERLEKKGISCFVRDDNACPDDPSKE